MGACFLLPLAFPLPLEVLLKSQQRIYTLGEKKKAQKREKYVKILFQHYSSQRVWGGGAESRAFTKHVDEIKQ